MNDQLVFIDVRNARAYVSRKRGTETSWTHEPCANWQQLEAMATAEIEQQGGWITMSGIYPCSSDLAALALWAEDILSMVTTPQEAETEYGLGSGTVRKAAESGHIPFRRSGATWLVYRAEVQRKWDHS